LKDGKDLNLSRAEFEMKENGKSKAILLLEKR